MTLPVNASPLLKEEAAMEGARPGHKKFKKYYKEITKNILQKNIKRVTI